MSIFNFGGQSARPKKWFPLEDNWLKKFQDNIKGFHHRLFHQHINGEENPNEIKFYVHIGCAKNIKFTDLHPYAPAIKYVQHEKNTCCFSNFASDMYDAREPVTEQAINLRL